MMYLFAIRKLGGNCSLAYVWNELAEVAGRLPEFKLSDRAFYRMIAELEANKYISTSTLDRTNPKDFPKKIISITLAGLKFAKSYAEVMPVLLPSKESDHPSPKRKSKIDLEQDDLADLTMSIIAEISNNLFDVESVDEKLRAKIEKSAGRIIAKVQKYV